MSAQVKKIRDDIVSDPKMILGSLLGYVDQIKSISLVVVWAEFDRVDAVDGGGKL